MAGALLFINACTYKEFIYSQPGIGSFMLQHCHFHLHLLGHFAGIYASLHLTKKFEHAALEMLEKALVVICVYGREDAKSMWHMTLALVLFFVLLLDTTSGNYKKFVG